MGLWHGSTVNFIVWGLWHAGLIASYRWARTWGITNRLHPRVTSGIGWVLTILGIMLGWIVFRTTSVTDAYALLTRLIDFGSYWHLSFVSDFYLLLSLICAGMLVVNFAQHAKRTIFVSWKRDSAEIMVLAAMAVCVFIFLQPIRQFIYFSF